MRPRPIRDPPTKSRLQGLGIRGSGWKAGAAKSKNVLGVLLPKGPKERQGQYWQSPPVPLRNQGRLSAVMAVSRYAAMVWRARAGCFRQWIGPREAAAQSRAWAARSRTALEARSRPRRELSSRSPERQCARARPLDGGRAR